MGVPNKISLTKFQLARIGFMVVAIGLFDWSELVVGNAGLREGINDGLLVFFSPANVLLNANPRLADAILIAISLLVDVAGVGLMIWSVFGKTVRPCIGLFLLYGLRQTVEMFCGMPAPEGMIWRYPGFPSLLVNYHVMNHFFFSGPTALIVYPVAELSTLPRCWVTAIGIVCILFVISALFSLRAHYTMDVFAGIVTPLFAILAASPIAKVLDPILGGKPKGATPA